MAVRWTRLTPVPQAATIGDWNGDGRPDLAVVNFNSHTVNVLLNSCQ